MSGKNQYPFTANWQSANPETGFLPVNQATVNKGSIPSGVESGTMSSTNTIYSQIWDISRMDNIGLEVNWSGTASGTFQIMCSNSGIAGNFHALTFDPVLAQPAGSSGGMDIDINQLPFKYMYLKYANASGSGTLTAYGQAKDLN